MPTPSYVSRCQLHLIAWLFAPVGHIFHLTIQTCQLQLNIASTVVASFHPSLPPLSNLTLALLSPGALRAFQYSTQYNTFFQNRAHLEPSFSLFAHFFFFSASEGFVSFPFVYSEAFRELLSQVDITHIIYSHGVCWRGVRDWALSGLCNICDRRNN